MKERVIVFPPFKKEALEAIVTPLLNLNSEFVLFPLCYVKLAVDFCIQH